MILQFQYCRIKSTNHDWRTHQLYSLSLKLLSTNRSCRFKWTPFWLLLFFKSSQQSPVLTTLSEKFMIDIACTLVSILPVSANGYYSTQLVLQMQGCLTLPKHFSPSCQYFCTSVISETFCNSVPYVSANSYSCNPPAARWLPRKWIHFGEYFLHAPTGCSPIFDLHNIPTIPPSQLILSPAFFSSDLWSAGWQEAVYFRDQVAMLTMADLHPDILFTWHLHSQLFTVCSSSLNWVIIESFSWYSSWAKWSLQW